MTHPNFRLIQALKCLVLVCIVATAVNPLKAAAPDKQAPTVPSNLVAAAITTTGFTISWTASTDNIGVTGYEVFLSTVSQGTVTTTSKVFTGLVSGTVYSVTVRARDAAGNWSVQSQPLSVTTAADTVVPSTPTGLVASSITTTGFTVSWTASTDNVGVTGYEVFLNGASQGTQATTSKVCTGLAAGTNYSVTVRARDAAANWSPQSSSLPVTTLADSVAPTIPTNLVSSGVSTTGFTVSWTASTDNVGVTGYEVFLDGTTQGTVTTTSKLFSGLQPATIYSVTVRARDAVGNWSPSSSPLSVSTVSDTTAPSVPTGLASSGISSSGFSVTWAVSTDNVGVTGYEVFLGGVSQSTVTTTSKDFTGLQPSTTYSVTVRARDAAGNWSAQSSPLSVTTSAAPTITYTISAGMSNVAVAKSDGTVWAWGQSFGVKPSRIGTITTAKSVATGGSHELILQQDGTVLAAGSNSYGQMADGTTTTPISRFTGVAAVAAGGQHSLAVKTDGTLYGWGDSQYGQVGNGKTGTVTSPTKLNQISGISKIAAGSVHSLALKSDGTVLAWGHNAYGEVGNGTTTDQLAPTAVTGLSGIIAIAAGGTHSLALKSDGTVWAWGDNRYGQLGDGTFSTRTRPVQVPGLTGVTSISAAYQHSLAQKADGSIWSWGGNSYRQLGDGSAVTKASPVRATILNSASRVAAGGYTSFAVLSDGTIRAWGSPLNGAFGDGGVVTFNVPFDDIIQLITSSYFDLTILRRDGTVWYWGENRNGDAGDGTQQPTVDAKQIQGLTGIVKIDSGIALRNDGTVLTWGPNEKGQLGDGTVAPRLTPAAVPGLVGVVGISSGMFHHAVLRSDGTVWTWGDNSQGALGDGTSMQRNAPIQVPGMYNVEGIFAGGPNTYALKPDGTVWCWGGDWWASTLNTNRIEYSPLQTPLSNIASISYNGSQAFFLTTNGLIYTAGETNLGVGPWYGSADPLLVPNLYNVVEASATPYGEVARASDGTVWQWNKNGNGSVASIDVVSGIANPNSIRSVSAAGIVYQNGKVILWNANLPPLRPSGFLNIPTQVADLRVASSAADSDGDGLPDAWELQQFGNLSHTAAADDDNDGLTNIQEYLRNTNATNANADGDSFIDSADEYPTDYYNGIRPSLTILGGNNQQAEINKFNTVSSDVAVWSADGFFPLVNAPVAFTVSSGGGMLAVDRSGTAPELTSLTLFTDADGTAHAFYRQPSTAGVTSTVPVNAGTAQVIFSTTSIPPQEDSDGDGLSDAQEALLGTNPNNPDTDGDGMPDGWEVANGLLPLVNDASGDADIDGIKNLDEYRWNLNPQVSELNNPATLTRFDYNLKDELTKYTPTLGGVVTFAPDKEGNLQSIH